MLWQYAEIVQDSTEIRKGALSYSPQAVEMELSNTQAVKFTQNYWVFGLCPSSGILKI
jgi:hypothetical protein